MVIGILKWLQLVALSTWLGSIVLLSFVVAPAVFGAFPEAQRAEAGRLMAQIFPGYYRLGYVCGLLLVFASGALWWSAQELGARWGVATVLAAVLLAIVLYAGLSVQPRAHALRPQIHAPGVGPEVKAEFDLLHRRAVQLNAGLLLGTLILAGISAANMRH